MNKIILFWTILTFFFLAGLAGAIEETAHDLVLLYTGDTHGHLEPCG
ncbi:MAG: hypothetical protein SV775_17085 [Thermodesulfobacteriota bacterium]|nr:hypothetical protein [Thermodesulfobacteriota bacterium]